MGTKYAGGRRAWFSSYTKLFEKLNSLKTNEKKCRVKNGFLLDLVWLFKVDIIILRCTQYWLYCLRSLSEVLSTKFSSRHKDSIQNNLRPLGSNFFPLKGYAPLFEGFLCVKKLAGKSANLTSEKFHLKGTFLH